MGADDTIASSSAGGGDDDGSQEKTSARNTANLTSSASVSVAMSEMRQGEDEKGREGRFAFRFNFHECFVSPKHGNGVITNETTARPTTR